MVDRSGARPAIRLDGPGPREGDEQLGQQQAPSETYHPIRQRTATGARLRLIPPAYTAFTLEMERHRIRLDVSMDRLSEVAGIADRAYSKLLYAETPSGRMARWETLQLVMDVLFPDGFSIRIEPHTGEQLSALSRKHLLRLEAAVHNRKLRRELMAELGSRGGKRRAENLSQKRIKEIGRLGGLASAKRRRKRTRRPGQVTHA